MKIDSNNYKNFTYFILILIGISVFFVYLIFTLVEKYQINLPFYVAIPSIPAIYGFLFILFDGYLWKWKIFKTLGVVIADDLNGVWEGQSKSSYDSCKKDIKTKLKIKQTATSVVINGEFENSKSVSLNANFERSDVDDGIALFYFYRNEPNYDAMESMAMHEGSVKLVYDKKENSLTGSYYSGRNRNNFGTIKVFRKSKK